MEKVYLGIGSNIGDRAGYLQKCVDLIENSIGGIISVSPVYETDPWGFVSENKFLNAVVEVDTALNPSGLLGRILMIEAELGRLREGKGFASRTIDLDILLFSDRIINEAALIVPHPRMGERLFVLKPLNDVAPRFIHPVSGKTINELLSLCTDNGQVSKTELMLLKPS